MHRVKAIVKRWPAFLFALVILFSGVTAWHYSHHILDSDAASELVLGKLLADQNKIVTSDWLYGNEVRIFNLNLIYMPLFKIFDDWQMIRFISILIFQALMALSFFYLSRRMKIGTNVFLISASLMLLPLSVVYGRMGLYHNYYIPCFVYGFLIAGLYLSILEHRGKRRLWQVLRLSAMLGLAFCSCLNGFRQLPGTMVPLLMTALVVALKNRLAAPDTLATIPRHSDIPAGLAGIVLLAGLAGLGVHAYVLPQYYYFRGMHASAVTLPTMESLRNLFIGYLSLFGYQEGRTLLSAGGMLSIGGAFTAVVILVVSLRDIFSKTRTVHEADSFMRMFYPVAMLCMTAVFLLVSGNENYPQYYLPAFVWIFPYLGSQIGNMPRSVKQFTVKQALIVLACLCMVFNGLYNIRYYFSPSGKQVVYDTRIDIQALDHLEGAVRFIGENELDMGYAEFWDADIMTETTDGRAWMIPLSFDTTNLKIHYNDVLTNLLYREKAFVENKSVFILLSNRFVGFFESTGLAQHAARAYEDAYYTIYTFDSSTAVWEYLNP